MMMVAAMIVAVPVLGLAQDQDVQPLKELSKKLVAARNAGDAAAVAALYAADAVMTLPSGETVRGREGVKDGFATQIREKAGSRLAFSADEHRWLGKDAAVWRAEWKLTGMKSAAPASGTSVAVLVRTSDGWQIAEHLTAATPAAADAPKKAKPQAHDSGEPHDHGPGGHSH